MFLHPLVSHLVDTCGQTCGPGVGKCQDRSFRFANSIRCRLLAKIVARETARGEFAQARLLSFLFSLLGPSETLHLRRAFYTDDLDRFATQLEKSINWRARYLRPTVSVG